MANTAPTVSHDISQSLMHLIRSITTSTRQDKEIIINKEITQDTLHKMKDNNMLLVYVRFSLKNFYLWGSERAVFTAIR